MGQSRFGGEEQHYEALEHAAASLFDPTGMLKSEVKEAYPGSVFHSPTCWCRRGLDGWGDFKVGPVLKIGRVVQRDQLAPQRACHAVILQENRGYILRLGNGNEQWTQLLTTKWTSSRVHACTLQLLSEVQ